MDNWVLFLDIDGVLNNLDLLFYKIPLVKNDMIRGKAEDNMIDQNCMHEIKQYMVDNGLQNSKKYIIIDDDSNMLDAQKENFFQTIHSLG